MNEDQLADLLAQHLDTLLEDSALSEALPTEVAELLTVAHNLNQVAPIPHPKFGATLKASLLESAASGNGTVSPTHAAFGSSLTSVVVIALLVGTAILALVISIAILSSVQIRPGSSTPTSIPTQIAPASPTILPVTPSPVIKPSPTSQATLPPTGTATPIIDVLPVVTATIEIVIEPPFLVPSSGGSGGNNGNSGDHNKGHGNDSDGNDDDNPGKSGDDD